MMPTKRKPIQRHRRAIEGSPEELWKAKRYVEAMALQPLIIFNQEYCPTHAEKCKARELRKKWGLDG